MNEGKSHPFPISECFSTRFNLLFLLATPRSFFLHLYLKQHLLFQIDPALLQQTLQQGGLLSQPLSVDAGLVSHSGSQLVSAADPSVQANLVLHPLTSLAMPSSTITPAQVTMAGLSEPDVTGTQQSDQDERCGSPQERADGSDSLPFPAAGSQDLSHVMGSSGMMTGGTGGQEITLTINNSSLTQAFASASCPGGGAANPQEITLTISGVCIHGLNVTAERWSSPPIWKQLLFVSGRSLTTNQHWLNFLLHLWSQRWNPRWRGRLRCRSVCSRPAISATWCSRHRFHAFALCTISSVLPIRC